MMTWTESQIYNRTRWPYTIVNLLTFGSLLHFNTAESLRSPMAGVSLVEIPKAVVVLSTTGQWATASKRTSSVGLLNLPTQRFSSSVALRKVSSIFSITWEFFLNQCEVKGQGCRNCKALWGKFVHFDLGLYEINWIEIEMFLYTFDRGNQQGTSGLCGLFLHHVSKLWSVSLNTAVHNLCTTRNNGWMHIMINRHKKTKQILFSRHKRSTCEKALELYSHLFEEVVQHRYFLRPCSLQSNNPNE